MRSLITIACLAVALGCSSSGSVGTRDTTLANYDVLFMAAQSAVTEMGGRIVMADLTSGVVVGRLDFEGSPVQLSVSLIRTPSSGEGPRSTEYIDISASAAVHGEDDPDEAWKKRLLEIEGEYIQIVKAIAGTTQYRGRGPAGITQP